MCYVQKNKVSFLKMFLGFFPLKGGVFNIFVRSLWCQSFIPIGTLSTREDSPHDKKNKFFFCLTSHKILYNL